MNPQRHVNLSRYAFGLVSIGFVTSLAVMVAGGRLRDRLVVNSVYFNLNAALVRHEPERIDQAIKSIETIGSDKPERERALRAVALSQMVEGNIEPSLNFWPKNQETIAEFLAWAKRAENQDDWETAKNWYWLATRLDGDDADHWYRLAQSAVNLGDLAEAGEYYLIALTAPTRTLYGRSNIMTRMGELAKRSEPRDWAEARQWFDEALRVNEFLVERDIYVARMGRAEAADQLREFQAALDDYRWVAAAQPGNYWANVHSGRLVWFLEKDLAQAESYLSTAMTIDDDLKWAYRDLAQVYLQAGQPDRAVKLFQQVLALDPNDSLAKQKLETLTNPDGS